MCCRDAHFLALHKIPTIPTLFTSHTPSSAALPPLFLSVVQVKMKIHYIGERKSSEFLSAIQMTIEIKVIENRDLLQLKMYQPANNFIFIIKHWRRKLNNARELFSRRLFSFTPRDANNTQHHRGVPEIWSSFVSFLFLFGPVECCWWASKVVSVDKSTRSRKLHISLVLIIIIIIIELVSSLCASLSSQTECAFSVCCVYINFVDRSDVGLSAAEARAARKSHEKKNCESLSRWQRFRSLTCSTFC